MPPLQPIIRSLLLVATVFSTRFIAGSAALASEPPAIEFDRAEKGVLYFKVPDGSGLPASIKAGLFDVKPLGRIASPESRPPYFVFAAKPCTDCLLDAAIYLVRPGNAKPVTFVYPGKILDPKTRQTVLVSHAFYGRCLRAQKNELYVVFQDERVDRRKRLQSSVFIAEPGEGMIEERLIERHLPKMSDTLRLVKSKACHEIEGRNRIMVKKIIDTRRPTEEEDEDALGDEDSSETSDAPGAAPAGASR